MSELQVNPNTQLVTVNDPSPTISVLWDCAVQQAVINTRVGPTVASRAYSMVHTAIYDAWAAYDPLAVGTQLGDNLQRPESENTEANKAEAMSFSAYRVLTYLFPDQVEIFNDVMDTLGFDIEDLDEDDDDDKFDEEDLSDPAVIGKGFAEALLVFCHNDGSNQEGNDPNGDGTPYSNISAYQLQNSAGDPIDIEFWTPENVPADFWEDSGGTSFPLGTWMSFEQFVCPRDDNTLDQDTIYGDEGKDIIHGDEEYFYLIVIRHLRTLMLNNVEFYELTPKQKNLIQEYSKLANIPELSESNAERMGEILEMAESDDLLSSWIEKIDEEISEQLGLFSEENLDYYENQKAKIKEFLPINQTLESYQLTPKQKSLIQEYSKLANLSELSESNAERMGEILEMAESDDLLSSWIEKIDEEISENLGLFSEEKLDYYENQKAKIKEFIVC